MSVILSVFFNPDFWIGLFSNALGRELGGPLGTAFGNFLGDNIINNNNLGETLRLGAERLGYVPNIVL
ncbi:MAG: hypothetical protein ACXV7G_10230 [Halobacteriota archaeon]